MNDAINVLSLWKKNQDVAEIVESGLLNQPEQLKAALLSLPPDQKKDALQSFEHIMSSLKQYISDLEEEKAHIKGQINQNIKSMQACLSYGSTSALNKDKRK